MKRLAVVVALCAAACGTRGTAGDRSAALQPCRGPELNQPGVTCEAVAASDLPEPVAAAVRSHQRAALASAAKVTRAGRVVYDLQLTGTRKTHLVVEPDGRVLTFE